MKLGDRLKAVEGHRVSTNPIDRLVNEGARPERADPFTVLKQRVQDSLYATLGSRIGDPSLTETDLQQLLLEELGTAIDEQSAPLSSAERAQLVEEIGNDVVGYGPIQSFLDDPTVTEIMVLSTRVIFIERLGQLERTDARYHSEEHLQSVIERIVTAIGRRIDESSPTVDARLPDGSRVNAVIPPLALDGPQLTIRKFSATPMLAPELIDLGTLTPYLADFLDKCVDGKCNVLVSGGTGTGKTTLLNMLSSFIPEESRVVTIEDAVELRLAQEHVVRLEARPANIEGRGQVTIRDLVRNSLRMRPDRIIVGEVRGAEALDMLQAMNTGHEGSLSTLHANSPRDALSRLETMVLMAGYDLPISAIREQIVAAVDLIVHLSRMRDGTRRITEVVEVEGLQGDVITLSALFEFNFAAGRDTNGEYLGTIEPTGLRPHFEERLNDHGIELDDASFGVFDDDELTLQRTVL